MEKCILSAVGGALAMLITLIIIANICVAREQKQKKKPYEHVDFVSAVTQEDCFLCGNGSEFPVSSYWGEDNIGIINLSKTKQAPFRRSIHDANGGIFDLLK